MIDIHWKADYLLKKKDYLLHYILVKQLIRTPVTDFWKCPNMCFKKTIFWHF